jgi:proteasome assembly chaperone (PAC2) family protein
MNVKISRRISLQKPVMIAGWPGMGNVALGLVTYLRESLKAQPFAYIDTKEFFPPDAVIIQNGLTALQSPPANIFYYVKSPPLIIFESEAQLSGREGVMLIDEILAFAARMKVQCIYTAAAFPVPRSYRETSTVFAVANEKGLRDLLIKHQIKTMDGGQISGLNGLLVGFAGEKGIRAACLMATLPYYAINLPNPRSSIAIAATLTNILNLRINLGQLDAAISEMDSRMAMIEDQMSAIFPFISQQQSGMPSLEKEKTPDYVMKRIENLFEEAKTDRKAAHKLKEELDRWNLYQLYEDKFLDLFKGTNS